MDKNVITTDGAPSKNGSAGRVVHLTAAIVIFVLAVLAVVITASFSFEFFRLRALQGSLEGSSEQLGNGLGQAFAVVFTMIFGVAAMILSVVSLVLGSTVWRYRDGNGRIFGIVATILSILFILGLLALLVAILIVT